MEFKIPSPLSLNGNLASNFKKFKINFEIYMKATGHNNKDSSTKTAILLNVLGEEAIELFQTFDLKDEERSDYEKVIKAFEDYTTPQTNIVMERFKFNSRSQHSGEPFESFVTDLRKLIKSCDFGNQMDSLLRDRIILGIEDKALQERILRETDPNLDKILKVCRATELGKTQAAELQAKSTNISVVQATNPGFRNKPNIKLGQTKNNNRSKLSFSGNKAGQFVKPKNNQPYMCKKCGRSHTAANCPAYGQKCNKCNGINHFAIGCKRKDVTSIENIRSNQPNNYNPNSSGQGSNEPQVRPIVDRTNQENNDCLFINEINKAINKKPWFEQILVDKQLQIPFKLDSGADVNVLPYDLYCNLSKSNSRIQLKQTDLMLEAYGGNKIEVIGKIELHCQAKKYDGMLEFIVTKSARTKESIGILGLESCERLNLIKRVNAVGILPSKNKETFIEQNIDIFEGVGKFKIKCHFDVNPNERITVKPPRRIPLALKPKVKKALDDLESQGIIAPVENPKSFVSNLVIVEKPNGSIRLCIDPQDLNKATKRAPHLIPSIKDITSELSNKSLFSVFDLKDGFYHVELDDSSSEHCAFSSPFGTYKFLRLPFGINVAPEVFQKMTERIFSGIKGVHVYFDDLLISSCNEEEHDKILKEVVHRARQSNVKFNKAKIQFKVPSVKYFGHVFSNAGISPDPERVRALSAMERPQNKKELQRILGLFNYLHNFVPNMAHLTGPLRELLKRDIEFCWLPNHEATLQNLKQIISNSPVLANFDESKSITLQCDSSKDGMGFTLMQNGQPVMYGSRSLTETQKNYSQTEKEMLSIVEATRKYHDFLYGRPEIHVQTDHKPIVSIMTKHVASINNARLQRMRLKLLKYNLNVTYVPGKNMYIADLLSRSFLNDKVFDDPELSEVVHSLSKYAQVSDERKFEIQQATKNDQTLACVADYVKNKWPESRNLVPDNVKHYYQMQDRLTVDEGLVFLDNRIIVPNDLRSKILTLLHEPHMGVEKTKLKARQTVYWPNINADVENCVGKCSVCEKYRSSNIKEPLIPQAVPNLPFEKVAVDLLEFRGKPYIALIDYYSKWLELHQLRDLTSNEVISKLKQMFSVHGIPKTVCCDNMPFNSYDFKKFAREWDFQCSYSSPKYPRSNGMAERAVQIAKNILRKCERDITVGLLEYRSTPVKGTGLTPSQVLMSRVLRTKVPISNKTLKPKIEKGVKAAIVQSQIKSKCYYDRSTKTRSDIKGPNVVFKDGREWKPAQLVQKHHAPRSYLIRNENGRILRRNTYHLRNSQTKPVFNYDFDLPIDEDRPNVVNNVPVQPLPDRPIEVVAQPQNRPNNPYQTRSGRTVRPPKRFQ